MEPRIQYAKTADGVSIAFWTIGEGTPLVVLPFLTASHIQIEWQNEGLRAFYERLAERAMVIRYDCRGLGMSQRDAMDFSLEAAERDLEAVVDRLGLQRFAVHGPTPAGHIRFAYPARHPERVSHLVLSATPLLRRSPDPGRQLAAIEPLMEREWDLYVEIYCRLIAGWDSPNAAPLAARTRASHSAASLRLAFEALEESPAPFLAAIQTPTLILHRLGSQDDSDAARMLAAGIANAHVVGIPGLTVGAYQSEIAVAAILDFVNSAPAAPGLPIAPPQIDTSAVRTILWTDIEEHTRMMQRLGDSKGRAVLREHERIVRQALKAHGGAEVKTMGDGFMASFASATRALECAIAMQRAFSVGAGLAPPEGAASSAPTEAIRVRIGVNAGEPIAEEDDLFGASVIAAARIAASAGGGEILASDVVRQLVAGKGFLFADRGEAALRGFEDPVRLYEVRWREEGGQ